MQVLDNMNVQLLPGSEEIQVLCPKDDRVLVWIKPRNDIKDLEKMLTHLVVKYLKILKKKIHI